LYKTETGGTEVPKMDHKTFRELGYQVIDWIADYMENGYPGPVSPNTKPGELLAELPTHPPEQGEPGEAVLRDFHNLILPKVTHWNDPRFYGYFPCNHSGPGILGDLLSAGLGVNAMSWATCPAATELEIRTLEWLGHMINLPWPGCIQDTASTGSLCAVLSAREAAATINKSGFYKEKPLTVYASEHAHSSVLKGVWIAGIGGDYIRNVPGDEHFAMRTDVLEEMIKEDLARGYHPCLVVSTVGTTSSTAVDPVPAIAAICDRHKLWHHVDAALAGSAAILPEMSWLMDGVDKADSFTFNPHKWLFTNFDCSAYFCKDPMALKRALAIQPDYLKTGYDAAAENFRYWSIQLGRRFRALKLWFVLRAYGVEGLREKIRLHIKMAQWFAEQVKAEPGLELIAEPKLNTVCFRTSDDERTKALMKAINDSGEALLTHTVLDGRYVIRVSFGQTHARFEHAEELWRLVLSNFLADSTTP
jgi:aromatic-L-amino-acid decarboxylase